MSWIFRKVFRYGPFRTSLSKGGVGLSWGFPGLRVGVSSRGRKYISVGIPGTGIYMIKYLDEKKTFYSNNSILKNPSKPSEGKALGGYSNTEPWWKQKHLLD